MRHAKAARGNSETADFDRPLTPAGEETASAMGRWLVAQQLSLDLIIASSAKRTHQTAARIQSAFSMTQEVTTRRELYLAQPHTIFQVLAGVEVKTNSLMIVGHNPGIEHVLYNLSTRYESIPPAAVIHFQFDSDSWDEIRFPDKNSLQAIWRAKDVLE